MIKTTLEWWLAKNFVIYEDCVSADTKNQNTNTAGRGIHSKRNKYSGNRRRFSRYFPRKRERVPELFGSASPAWATGSACSGCRTSVVCRRAPWLVSPRRRHPCFSPPRLSATRRAPGRAHQRVNGVRPMQAAVGERDKNAEKRFFKVWSFVTARTFIRNRIYFVWIPR